jgi:hypothetical protein
MYSRFCNCRKTKNLLVEQNDDADMNLVPAVSLEIQIETLSVFLRWIYWRSKQRSILCSKAFYVFSSVSSSFC